MNFKDTLRSLVIVPKVQGATSILDYKYPSSVVRFLLLVRDHYTKYHTTLALFESVTRPNGFFKEGGSVESLEAAASIFASNPLTISYSIFSSYNAVSLSTKRTIMPSGLTSFFINDVAGDGSSAFPPYSERNDSIASNSTLPPYLLAFLYITTLGYTTVGQTMTSVNGQKFISSSGDKQSMLNRILSKESYIGFQGAGITETVPNGTPFSPVSSSSSASYFTKNGVVVPSLHTVDPWWSNYNGSDQLTLGNMPSGDIIISIINDVLTEAYTYYATPPVDPMIDKLVQFSKTGDMLKNAEEIKGLTLYLTGGAWFYVNDSSYWNQPNSNLGNIVFNATPFLKGLFNSIGVTGGSGSSIYPLYFKQIFLSLAKNIDYLLFNKVTPSWASGRSNLNPYVIFFTKGTVTLDYLKSIQVRDSILVLDKGKDLYLFPAFLYADPTLLSPDPYDSLSLRVDSVKIKTNLANAIDYIENQLFAQDIATLNKISLRFNQGISVNNSAKERLDIELANFNQLDIQLKAKLLEAKNIFALYDAIMAQTGANPDPLIAARKAVEDKMNAELSAFEIAERDRLAKIAADKAAADALAAYQAQQLLLAQQAAADAEKLRLAQEAQAAIDAENARQAQISQAALDAQAAIDNKNLIPVSIMPITMPAITPVFISEPTPSNSQAPTPVSIPISNPVENIAPIKTLQLNEKQTSAEAAPLPKKSKALPIVAGLGVLAYLTLGGE